ncbi:putative HTH-type transcriptional regulator YwnA [compost metagenome]
MAKPADVITLDQIYIAVRQNNLLGTSKNEPNPHCMVGRQINQHLNSLYDRTEQVLIQELSQKTLADFSGQFN